MVRDMHKNTPPLQWDEDLEKAAQSYADNLHGNLGVHDPNNKANGWGETMYWLKAQREGKCADAILSW